MNTLIGAEGIDFANHPLLRALATFDPNKNDYSYYFAAAGEQVNKGGYSGGSDFTSAWSASERSVTIGIFSRYSEVADLTFTQTTSRNGADFNMQMVDSVPGGFAGYAGGSTFVVGSADIGLITHELGHSLELDHPFNGAHTLPGVTRNDDTDPGQFGFNSVNYTIEAYRFGGFHDAQGIEMASPDSLGVLDIAALQAVYGANDTHNGTNTSYGITNSIVAIWDAGGRDKIDFSDSFTDGRIDLRAATLEVADGGLGYTSIIDTGGNPDLGAYSIAYGVTIEDAHGGAGDDLIHGNAGDNWLRGGLGADTLYGGAGNDTLEGSPAGAQLNKITTTSLGSQTNSKLQVVNYEMPGSTTIDIVLRFDAGVSHRQRIASYTPDGPGGVEIDLELWDASNPNMFAFVNRADGGSYSIWTGITRADVLDGAYHRLTLSRDAASGEMRFYLDGVHQRSETHDVTGPLESGGSLVFGQSQGVFGTANDPDLAFEGDFGPIAIYDRALTDAQVAARSNIADLANAANPDLVSYWTPQAGSSFADATGGSALQAVRTGGIETIALKSDKDVLYGEAGNDRLLGSVGADTLYGGTGDDFIHGGGGADRMVGGLGDDFYTVGSALDIVEEAASAGIDTVRSFIDYTLGTHIENGFLGFARITTHTDMIGNAVDNVIRGSGGNNVITGLGGDDQIFGRLGNDRLLGGAGDDRLIAGGGADRLDGGAGADVLSGGSGADIFVFRSVADSLAGGGNRDRVTTFQSGQDTVDLSGIDANTTRAGNQAFSFVGTDSFSGTAGEVRLNVLAGKNAIVVAADVDGDGGADFQLLLNGTGTITASDFIF